MSRRSLGWVPVVALLLAGEPSVLLAQTKPAGSGPGGAGAGSPLEIALPVLQVGLLVGGAWVGSVIGRRLINNRWISLIGARLGAGLGLEAMAGLGLLGFGFGGALPAGRVMAPQLVSTPAASGGGH
ncbi:MAG: hypothetical protein WCO00_16840 [Rhodospirillaceae bacterium]